MGPKKDIKAQITPVRDWGGRLSIPDPVACGYWSSERCACGANDNKGSTVLAAARGFGLRGGGPAYDVPKPMCNALHKADPVALMKYYRIGGHGFLSCGLGYKGTSPSRLLSPIPGVDLQ